MFLIFYQNLSIKPFHHIYIRLILFFPARQADKLEVL